ncbi:MoxR family ATPase [Pyrococcus sp. ST04]|uniref:AAA family ATPase n=1 Tax=Pyrococcus sp. ST04 TaxID=1183377 RepID=UPI0002605AA7|nr:MoxR family ATPase [Pyrococcus sp. ST04]AFK22104.1 methanol dehydrogenase regulatory protein [Pyrococcus sp. ST04]
MHEKIKTIIEEIGLAFVGHEDVVKKVLAAALANGNVLFEDNPGLGKTLLAKAFARVLGLEYRRVQFTPDLLPSDIIGTKVWRQEKGIFEVVKGPIFTNVLLADEINRAPPKTQSALLEAMEERQVTIEGETFKLERPFFVLATQNPLEFEGTYPLPEAQLDRFLVRMSIGYPKSEDEEVEILKARLRWRKDDPTVDLNAVISREEFIKMQDEVENNVRIHEDVLRYIVRIVRAIREDERVEAGPSPRGGLALMKLAKANAYIEGRNYVIPDDVKEYAIEALAHRLVLKPEYSLEKGIEVEIVKEALEKVPVPKNLRY